MEKTDKAVEKGMESNGTLSNVDDTEKISLHWDSRVERRGLGDLIYKANHIALVVSDVGRSSWFYSDVLGLQQIRRPNFDRHGAWFTMGNIELHLILGTPVVPSGDSLIVGHISLESRNIGEVLNRLREMDIPFETNVSVPKGGGTGNGVVTQFFLRDTDGYYIELCNCDVLTDFCLGNSKIYLEGYEESCTKSVDLALLTKMSVLATKAKKGVETKNEIDLVNYFDNIDNNHIIVDETKLVNLLKRTEIWGDILQGQNEGTLRRILKKTNNDVPSAIEYIKATHNGLFQAPAIYKDNNEKIIPSAIKLK